MLTVELSEKEERLLEKVAKRRGKTKEYCAKKAIIESIEDMADYDIAVEVLKNSTGERHTMTEVEERLGLVD